MPKNRDAMSAPCITSSNSHQKEWGIRTEHNVRQDLVIIHLNMADSNAEAKHFLQLELDRRAHLDDLVAQVLSMRERCGEFSS
jgi:hypothetical protein